MLTSSSLLRLSTRRQRRTQSAEQQADTGASSFQLGSPLGVCQTIPAHHFNRPPLTAQQRFLAMALVSLLPKRFRPSDDKTTPAKSEPSLSSQPSQIVQSSPSASLRNNVTPSEVQLAEPGRDANGKFKLPPIALYVSGAAVSHWYQWYATHRADVVG